MKFDIGKQIEDHIRNKYPELYSLPEEVDVKIIPDDIKEKLDSNILTPFELSDWLKSLKSDELADAVLDVKYLLSDKMGDLHATYRYESEREGAVYEKYIDSIYRRIKSVGSLSREGGEDHSTQVESANSPLSNVSNNKRITKRNNNMLTFNQTVKKIYEEMDGTTPTQGQAPATAPANTAPPATNVTDVKKIKVTFNDGKTIEASVASNLTSDQIKAYFNAQSIKTIEDVK